MALVGLGLVLTSPQGQKVQRDIRCGFKTTNDEAEYEALIAGLTLTWDIKMKKMIVESVSQLSVNHFEGNFQIKELRLETYLKIVKELKPYSNI